MPAKTSKRPSMKRKTTKPAARKKIGKKSLARHGAAQQKRAKARAKARRAQPETEGVVYSDLRRSIGEGLLGRLLNS